MSDDLNVEPTRGRDVIVCVEWSSDAGHRMSGVTYNGRPLRRATPWWRRLLNRFRTAQSEQFRGAAGRSET